MPSCKTRLDGLVGSAPTLLRFVVHHEHVGVVPPGCLRCLQLPALQRLAVRRLQVVGGRGLPGRPVGTPRVCPHSE